MVSRCTHKILESVTVTDNERINKLCSGDADRQTDSSRHSRYSPGARLREGWLGTFFLITAFWENEYKASKQWW